MCDNKMLNDEQFLDFCRAHSHVKGAKFHRDDVNRLVALAGAPDVADVPEWSPATQIDYTGLVAKAIARRGGWRDDPVRCVDGSRTRTCLFGQAPYEYREAYIWIGGADYGPCTVVVVRVDTTWALRLVDAIEGGLVRLGA